MSPQEHITVCTSEEAGEVAELAFELGRTALKLSKDLHKALRFGFTDTDPESGKTKIEMLVGELIDLKACVELLQESGVPLFGLDNRDKIEAKKKKVMKYLKIAENLGTVEKPKPKPLTQAERDRVFQLLYNKLNPKQQQDYGQQLYENVVKKITEKYIPEGSSPFLTQYLIDEMKLFKTELIKNRVTSHSYYTLKNKPFMDMIDVQIIADNNSISIQPNSALEILMHGVGPVSFFRPKSNADLESLWELYKDQCE